MMRPDPPPHGPARRSVRERRATERRVLRVGLAISLVLHIVLMGIFGGLLERRPAQPEEPAGPVLVEPPTGMRAVAVRPVDPLEPDPAAVEPPSPTPPSTPARPPEIVLVPEAEREAVDERSIADRLAPRLVDPRLWRPMVVLPASPTLRDVEARVAAAIELLSDSALAETERAIRARDWTVRDADGGRWGISPGQLHLGTLTLPLPIVFPTDPETAALEDEWFEIRAQLDRAMFLENFESRVRAIRERRDRERAERRGESGDGNG